MTPYERLKGKKPSRRLVKVAEKLDFQELRTTGFANSEARFQEGIFLGVRDKSDECTVWTPQGLKRARTVRRKPEDEKWDAEAVSQIDVTPFLEAIRPAAPRPTIDEGRANADEQVGRGPRVRRCRLYPSDFADFGHTRGCVGCEAMIYKRGYHRKHSETCRERIETRLAETLAGRSRLAGATAKMNKVLEEAIERDVARSSKRASEADGTERAGGSRCIFTSGAGDGGAGSRCIFTSGAGDGGAHEEVASPDAEDEENEERASKHRKIDNSSTEYRPSQVEGHEANNNADPDHSPATWPAMQLERSRVSFDALGALTSEESLRRCGGRRVMIYRKFTHRQG